MRLELLDLLEKKTARKDKIYKYELLNSEDYLNYLESNMSRYKNRFDSKHKKITDKYNRTKNKIENIKKKIEKNKIYHEAIVKKAITREKSPQ